MCIESPLPLICSSEQYKPYTFLKVLNPKVVALTGFVNRGRRGGKSSRSQNVTDGQTYKKLQFLLFLLLLLHHATMGIIAVGF